MLVTRKIADSDGVLFQRQQLSGNCNLHSSCFIDSPEKTDACGLLLSLGRALKLLGMENVLNKHCVLGVDGMPVLVGGGTDEASVNVGKHRCNVFYHGCTAWSWCYVHWLELACKDAF